MFNVLHYFISGPLHCTKASRGPGKESSMSENHVPPKARFWPQPVYAGFPSPGDDYIEPDLNVHDLVVTHPLTTYFIRVRGDSMSGACICAGDVVSSTER